MKVEVVLNTELIMIYKLVQDIKYVIKSLKKNRTYSVLNMSGLAIGFSVITFIVLFLITEHRKDTDIPNYKNIYRLYDIDNKSCALDYNLKYRLLDEYPEVEGMSAVRTFYGLDIPLISEENNVVEKKFFATNNTFFTTFDINIIKSMSDVPLPDLQSTVITETLAHKLFPNSEALGKKINFFGFVDLTISAIVSDFSDRSLNCNMIINGDNPKFNNWGQSDKFINSSIYLVLNKATNLTTFGPKLDILFSEQYSKAKHIGLQRLDQIYLNSNEIDYNAHQRGNQKTLNIFLAISILILILSNINNFNYNSSLYYNRFNEIGVRMTNGARMKDILRLLFLDNFIKIFISLIFSICLTLVVSNWIKPFLNYDLDFSLLLKLTVLIYASILVLSVVLLNSFASILIFSKLGIISFLSGGKSKYSIQSWKSVLIIIQFSIAVSLLISIITVNKQVDFFKHHNLGFEKENLVCVRFPIGSSNQKTLHFKDKIKLLSSVKDCSLSNGVPGRINYGSSSNVTDNMFQISSLLVDANFIKTMGIKLKSGRDFRKGENNQVCIINETALKKYGWDNFEGKQFKGRGGLDIIGICSDFNIYSLHDIPTPVCLIYGDKRNDYAELSMKINPQDTGLVLKEIESEWNAIFDSYPFDYIFYDQFFDSMYRKEEIFGQVLNLFSLIALLITGLGILSISFQNSLNKTKEIGVRKVNGAHTFQIIRMLNKDFAKWVLIAFVIACPIAYYTMSKWLENFAYKTELSWWIFALAGLIAMGIALLTVSIQSYRAATRNPVESLRYE